MNMANGGYYYSYYKPTAPYYYSYSQQQPARRGGAGGGSRPSVHLFLFLATLFLFAAVSLYARCESAVESLLDQLRAFLILSPLLLIVVVHLWVAANGGDRRGGGLIYFLAQLVGGHHHQRNPYGRLDGGGACSPWGVALVLVLVLFLVLYQSSLQNRWFPLFSW